GTITLAGIEAAAGLLLVSETVVPPTGAAAFRNTAVLTSVPPATLDWALPPPKLIAVTPSGTTVRVLVSVTPPKEADTVTVVAAVTDKVLIGKLAEGNEPAGTVTLGGTDATAGLLLASVTVTGATVAPDIATEPWDPAASTTVAGLRRSDWSTVFGDGSTVSELESDEAPSAAEMVTVVAAGTAEVETKNR